MGKMLNEEEKKLIQRFFDFELSEKELKTFQERMETDAGFVEEMKHFKDANTIINRLEEQTGRSSELPEEIKSILEEGKEGKSVSNLWKILFPLLLLIGILLVGGYFWNQGNNNNTDEEKIYAGVTKYITDMSDNIMRGDGELHVDSLSSIERVLQEIKSLEGKPDRISKGEELLLSLDDPYAKELVYWWMIKFHLGNEDKASAQKLLIEISENEDFNSSKKAKKILKDF